MAVGVSLVTAVEVWRAIGSFSFEVQELVVKLLQVDLRFSSIVPVTLLSLFTKPRWASDSSASFVAAAHSRLTVYPDVERRGSRSTWSKLAVAKKRPIQALHCRLHRQYTYESLGQKITDSG
jgi:hypothetical protein